MADVKDIAGSKPNQVPPPEDAALDLEPETEQAFLDVLVSGDEAGVRTLVAELHHADAADLLERLNADGLTLIAVTHDSAVARRARRRLRLAKGVVTDITR